jgi:TonB family protein
VIVIKWIALNIALLVVAQCYSQTIEKSKSLSLNFKEQSLSSVLEEIRSQASVNFVYNDKLVSDVKVTIKLDSGSIEYAIKKILDGSDISYKEFPPNSYVLYKDKKPVEKHFRAVILNKNVVEMDTARILIEPKLISKINLTYPTDAIKHNLEGKVLIKILINREGDVSRTNLEQTSGSTILDSAAIDYTHSLKFIPAKADGKPIHIWISMLFKYFLDNK